MRTYFIGVHIILRDAAVINIFPQQKTIQVNMTSLLQNTQPASGCEIRPARGALNEIPIRTF
jgi:hypothetical protein